MTQAVPRDGLIRDKKTKKLRPATRDEANAGFRKANAKNDARQDAKQWNDFLYGKKKR